VDLFGLARRGDLSQLIATGEDLLADREESPFAVWIAAIETDRAEVLSYCLDHGLDPNGNGDEVPLVHAALHKATHCLELLLERGANVDRPDGMQRVPLSAAILSDWPEGVTRLLAADALPFFPGDDWVLAPGLAGGMGKPLQKPVLARRKALSAEDADIKSLVAASRSGDLETLKRLATPERVNRPWRAQGSTTALMAAAEAGRVEAIDLLVARNADVEARDRAAHPRERGEGTTLQLSTSIGWTALMRAAFHGRTEAVKALLACGADPDVTTPEGDTALHIAAARKAPKVVRALLDGGASPALRNDDDEPPLLQACYFGPLETVRALVEAGADIGADLPANPFLLAACWEGKTAIAEHLIGLGAQFDSASGEHWDALSIEGRTDALKRLLPHLDIRRPRSDGASPLMVVAQNGHVAGVRLLAERGAELAPDESLTRLLGHVFESTWRAEPKDVVKAVAAILARFRPSSTDGPDLIGRAARHDLVDVVEILARAGLDVEAPNAPSPLAQHLEPDMVATLLRLGADPNGRDPTGQPAVAFAILSGSVESARLLLEAGADPGTEGAGGSRPIELAALTGNENMCRLFPASDPARLATRRLVGLLSDYPPPDATTVAELLNEGADPNAIVFLNRSCALLAAARRCWDVFDLLVRAGADPGPSAAPFLATRALLRDGERPEFLTHVGQLGATLGVEATPIEGSGGFAYDLSGPIKTREEQLLAEGQNATAAHFLATSEVPRQIAVDYGQTEPFWTGWWRAHPIHPNRLLTLPTGDPRTVIALISPHAGESDVGVFEILEKLDAWEHLGWTLIGVGYDAFELKFERLPEDTAAFAAELEAFCPDLVDQGVESVDALEKLVVEHRRVSFWWD